MKVLLLFPQSDGQTGPAIKEAFERLGHTVLAIEPKEPQFSYRTWNACVPGMEYKPDLIFCSRTSILSEYIEMLKTDLKKVVICTWNVDSRNSIEEWKHLFPLVKLSDYYFVVDKKHLKEWREINPNTHWLPQGLQDEIYKIPMEITEADHAKYDCDVSFAGRERGFRKPFLNAIREMKGVKFLHWGGSKATRVINEEHNKMVACSKINLGCSAYPGNEANVSVRDYKIMGARGFLLELWRFGLEDVFPEGNQKLSIYERPEDLPQLIRFVLEHKEEREKVSENAYHWVNENATYTHRIAQALKIMGLS